MKREALNGVRDRIEKAFKASPESLDRVQTVHLFAEFRVLLNEGHIRAAERVEGTWVPNIWVKKGILLGFRAGILTEIDGGGAQPFFDKETLPLRKLSKENEVRIVPGGSAIRDGSYVAKGVICMPPMYVNIGAYVDEGTMIDSHALVGSCAQIGKGVHLSAGVQVGGVLEPVGALPVIIEDHALIGGNCGIYEGTIVRESAVLAAGVILAGGTAVYDLVHEKVYRQGEGQPLIIPEKAVVVPGSRKVRQPWGAEQGVSVATPVIVKYRDEKTDLSTLIEEALR